MVCATASADHRLISGDRRALVWLPPHGNSKEPRVLVLARGSMPVVNLAHGTSSQNQGV